MSFTIKHLSNKEEWLEAKLGTIGGSSASSILGQNPYKSNKEAWAEIIGIKEAEEISNKPNVRYGTLAESHLRELFALDFETVYKVENPPTSGYDLIISDKYPYMVGTLDGTLIELATNRKGILEIKTTEILSSMQNERWYDSEKKVPVIPMNYLIQVLHYLMITGYDFAVLHAQLKYERDGDIWTVRRSFLIERGEYLDSIEYLEKEEKNFYEKYVKTRKEPPLVISGL